MEPYYWEKMRKGTSEKEGEGGKEKGRERGREGELG